MKERCASIEPLRDRFSFLWNEGAIRQSRRYAMKRSRSVAYGLSFRAYAIAYCPTKRARGLPL
ncbi:MULTISPECIES: hypothetical protein [Moorena]|uniref:hypothetical protein n=1 Tax=Moorena TaxID=1155738 RepID=UPI00030C3A33|nr:MULTISPECIES: hypothetical protein [Moorena]NEP65932.1 hypothetical protein [Moorena sp. SIO3A5]NEQ07784.1 hypothetical protein [Moorena sp. SIO4E2]